MIKKKKKKGTHMHIVGRKPHSSRDRVSHFDSNIQCLYVALND